MADILPFKTTSTRPQLRDAMLRRQLVRVWRGNMEHGSFCGYITGIGQQFVLLWVLGDNLQFDGMFALRHRDITDIEAPDAHHRFLEKALASNGLEATVPADIELDSAQDLIRSASRGAPIVSVHVDNEEEADICFLGRVIGLEDDGFLLQEVNPDAEWLREPSYFGWDELSTVVWDDPYGRALFQIAGEPPAMRNDGDSGFGRAR